MNGHDLTCIYLYTRRKMNIFKFYFTLCLYFSFKIIYDLVKSTVRMPSRDMIAFICSG